MRKLFLAALCLAWLAPAALAAGPDRPDPASMSLRPDSMKFESAPAAGNGPPSIILMVAPEFYQGSFGPLSTRLQGVDLTHSGGTSKGFGITFQATKPLTEVFSLSFIYQFAYNDFEGGDLVPAGGPIRAWTKQHATSHMTGLIGTINMGRFGKLEPSLLFGWDTYDGVEGSENLNTAVRSEGPTAITNDRATSLMFFYSIDLPVSDSFVFTPYVGWRSVHVVLDYRDGRDQSAWAHLLSGGLSAKYASGNLSLILRAGFNHRVSKDDIPGLSTRAVAPGVTHMGWMTSWDRTIATYGVALDCNFGPGLLEISYDGFAGSDTTYHKGARVLVFPF